MGIEAKSLDWPQSAAALLADAKAASATRGELVKLVMNGIRRLDSWLIENRILPVLADKDVKILGFSLTTPHHDQLTAAIVPLPDASAFACSASGRWSDLETYEALAAIQYVGSRYALGNHWARDFEATFHTPGGTPAPVTPRELADLWEQTTGARPHGFGAGVIDQVQATCVNAFDRAFNIHGLLGL